MVYFDGPAAARQVLLWAVATRLQLDRWEADVAEIVRLGLRLGQPPGRLVWSAEINRHFAITAARNLLRALDLNSAGIDAPLLKRLKGVRDLLEHWDENMPIFNVNPQGVPQYPSGKAFAAQNPGKSPYSQFNWNSDDGPLVAPGVPAWRLHSILDEVEAATVATNPYLADYVPERPPSPWLGDGAGSDRWWPRDRRV